MVKNTERSQKSIEDGVQKFKHESLKERKGWVETVFEKIIGDNLKNKSMNK